jgi:hypothetical protein
VAWRTASLSFGKLLYELPFWISENRPGLTLFLRSGPHRKRILRGQGYQDIRSELLFYSFQRKSICGPAGKVADGVSIYITSKPTHVGHSIYNLLPTEIEGFDSLAELALLVGGSIHA